MFPSSYANISTPAPHNACTFSSTALRHFNSIGVSRCREARAVLIREGFAADHLLIICSGSIKVTASSDGRLLLLRVAGPGDILGLSALQEHTLYRVTAETIVPSIIKSIPRADFVRFMETHADVSRTTALALARAYNGTLLTARRLALFTPPPANSPALCSTGPAWMNSTVGPPTPVSPSRSPCNQVRVWKGKE